MKEIASEAEKGVEMHVLTYAQSTLQRVNQGSETGQDTFQPTRP